MGQCVFVSLLVTVYAGKEAVVRKWEGIVLGRTGLMSAPVQGIGQGAEELGGRPCPSGPSHTAFGCLGFLRLVQLRALLLILLVFWDFPEEEEREEFCTCFPTLHLATSPASLAVWKAQVPGVCLPPLTSPLLGVGAFATG